MRLKVPKLRAQTFETAIIERYRRRENSVEGAYRTGKRREPERTYVVTAMCRVTPRNRSGKSQLTVKRHQT